MSDAIDRAVEVLWASINDKGIRGRLYRKDCDHLVRVLADHDLLEQDLEVHIEDHSLTGQPSTCVVKHHGVTVFDGVSREALLTVKRGISEQEAQERERAAAVKALRDAADVLDKESCLVERTCHKSDAITLRVRADCLAQQGHEQEGQR